MTNPELLARLDRLPPSEKLNAFRDALRAFLAADRPGIYAAPEAWGEAYADKGIAWDALSAAEKQACREGGGMKPGREMDALVGREVFGFTTWRAEKMEYVAGRDWIEVGDYFYYPNGTGAQAHRLPDYSTDISAAWQVWQAVKTLDRHKAACFWSALRSLVQIRLDSENLINDTMAALYMEPEDICKAMLEAHGMRMLPDWYYE